MIFAQSGVFVGVGNAADDGLFLSVSSLFNTNVMFAGRHKGNKEIMHKSIDEIIVICCQLIH